MPDLGPHATTIGLCYAAVAIVIGGLIAWLMTDGRRLARQLAEFEARGVRRRSAGRSEPAPEPNSRS